MPCFSVCQAFVKHEFERTDRVICGEQPYESDDDYNEVDNDAKTLEGVAESEQPPVTRVAQHFNKAPPAQEPVGDVCVDYPTNDEDGNHDHDQDDDKHAPVNMMPENDEDDQGRRAGIRRDNCLRVQPASSPTSPDHQDIDEHKYTAEEPDKAPGEDWSPGSTPSTVEEIDEDADISPGSPAEDDGGSAAVMSDDDGNEDAVSSSSPPTFQDMVSSPEEPTRTTFTPSSSQVLSENLDTEPHTVLGDLGATQPLDFDQEGVASPYQSSALDNDGASTFPSLSASPTQDLSQDGAERGDIPMQTQESAIEE